jgi:GH35 family endo-1,4-beta-xylanase
MDALLRGSVKFCTWPGCDQKHASKGFCAMHYQRQKRGSDMNQPEKTAKIFRFCEFPRCNRPYKAHGLCGFHRQRQLKGMNMEQPPRGTFLNWKHDHAGYLVASQNNKAVRQHRLFWEMHNGRKLEKFENIHHINGIRDDNRIENLELWTKPQPIGQRPEDLVAWVIDHYRELVEARLALF